MNWMTPILFSIGWLQVRTVDICLLIGLFFGLFVYWRKVKYDSEYNEAEAFDGFLISLIVGWLAGRVGYVLLNFDSFGLNPANWLNVLAYPGLNIVMALAVSGLYLHGWARRHKFEAFKLLDFWATAASLTLAFYYLGFFLSGLGFGYETDWVVGLTPPGVMMKLQPVQLYWTIFYVILFIYLVRVEYKFRYYEWYKNGRSVAENGFIVASFMIWSGVMGLVLVLLGPGTMVIAGIDLEWLVQVLILLWGVGLLWMKSGRKFGGNNRKRKIHREERYGIDGQRVEKKTTGESVDVVAERTASRPRRIEIKRPTMKMEKEGAIKAGKVEKVTKTAANKKTGTKKEMSEMGTTEAKMTNKNALRSINLQGISRNKSTGPSITTKARKEVVSSTDSTKTATKAKNSKDKVKKEVRRFKLN